MQSALHFLEWQIVRPNFDTMLMARDEGDELIKDLSLYKSVASKLKVRWPMSETYCCVQTGKGTWLWPSVCLIAWSIRKIIW